MLHTFIIEPKTYIAFENEAELIEKCKEWSLLSEKATKPKAFFYKGNSMNLACSIIGYADNMTAVIQFENNQHHCIHPSYLKEMQTANYGQKVSLASEDSSEPETAAAEAQLAEISPVTVEAKAKVEEMTSDLPPAADTDTKPQEASVEAPPKGKVKKGKTPKLELPEEKVKMTATVQEFTTVPNNFSDNEDEVVIYEAVSIIDPETIIGVAWSSHSATLKKLELEIGDTITFDAKIVAKKLTKHPVPYKINNPAKIVKEQQA